MKYKSNQSSRKPSLGHILSVSLWYEFKIIWNLKNWGGSGGDPGGFSSSTVEYSTLGFFLVISGVGNFEC